MDIRTIYTSVFVAYIAIVLFASFRSRGSRDPSGFWTENRSVSGMRAGISLSATFMSISWSVVYGIEVFLKFGLGGFFVLSLPWLVVLGLFVWLAPKLRNIPVFSQPELIGKKFSRRAGQLAAIPILLVFIIWAGAEMDVAASLLSSVTGLNSTALLLTIAVVIGLYMMTSGTHAVILTDVIQYLLVVVFFILILWAGTGTVTPNPTVTTLDFDRIHPLFILITFVAYLPGWLAETDIWVRLQITPDGRQARLAMMVALANGVLFVFIMPMLAARLVPAGISDGTAGVASLLALIRSPIGAGLAALGLVAASMSTIDTCVNVAAMTLSYDLRQSRTLAANRIAVWIAVAAAVLFAIYSNSLMDAFYLSSGLLSTALFIPVMACYRKRGSDRGVRAVLIGAPLATIFFYAIERASWFAIPGANGVSYILMGFGTAVILYAVFSRNTMETLR